MRLRGLPIAVCISLVAPGPALAGLAHVGSSLICSDCHTMHYSAQHSYSGGPPTFVPYGNGPFGSLLKASPNDLCLSCHDGTGFAPDVLGYPTDSSYVRQSGALNTPSTSGYPIWTGHTLGSTSAAPGGTWTPGTGGLECVDCHLAHGSVVQYRNLKFTGAGRSTTWLTYSTGATNNLGKDVWIHDAVDAQHRYGVAGVEFNRIFPNKSRYGDWCASCHTSVHGSGGSANMGGASGGDSGSSPWKRHPTADVNIGAHPDEISSLTAYQSHQNKVKVMSGSGNWTTATDLTPTCFSCHKAHGNKNAFGLIYMSGTGTVTEEGDTGGTGLQDLCRQCHIQ